MTKATIIPSLTNNPPSRASPGSFITDGDSFLSDLPGVVLGVNTAATELNTWNTEVETFKNQASSSQTNAASSSTTSLTQARNAAASMVQLWVSGTTYPAGQIVYSNVDAREYKRITVGAGTTDPSSDPTNWEPLGWEYITNYPDIRPTLDLNFAGSQTVDPRITFTRNSIATYFDKFGVMQTAGVNQPRIDFDPVTGECKGLLLEEQRTNLLTYSEQFDNVAWGKGTDGSISANTVVSPDGTSNADAYTWPTSTGAYAFLNQTATATSNIANTFSVWLKRPSGSGNRTVRLSVSDTTSSTGNSATFTVTENWQRFEFTYTSATNTGLVGVGLNVALSGTSIAAGDILHVWGAQLEVGSFPTSYIPTTTAKVTRTAESAVMTGANFSSWNNNQQGTLYFDGAVLATGQSGNPGMASIDDTTNTNRALMFQSGTNVDSRVVFGGNSAGPGNTTTVSANNTIKASLAYAVGANQSILTVNGVSGSANSPVGGFSPTRLVIGGGVNLGVLNGQIKKLAYYPKRLPNATLQAITKP